MEIIFKEENKKLFGSTKIVGIGKRQPKLIYGNKAKELREKSLLSVDGLALEFGVKPSVIQKIENQTASLNEKICQKYSDKFNVTKEYFFDLDLETLILNGEGHILKSFENGTECLKKFNAIMEEYYKALSENKKYIEIEF